MFILTNSEELVKDVFELFSKFNHPSLHGADHGRIEILLCQGLAPTAHLVYYCVKRLSRIFFKSLTPAAGRRDITDVAVGAAQSLSNPSGADQWEAQDGCWNGQQRLGGPLWESRKMLCSEIVIRRPQVAGRRSPVANPCHICRSSISPIVHSGPPKAPFIGELAAKGGLRG